MLYVLNSWLDFFWFLGDVDSSVGVGVGDWVVGGGCGVGLVEDGGYCLWV